MPTLAPSPYRNLIVVGASLGGVEVLPRFVAQLPPESKAAVLIVMHLGANSPQYLPSLLQPSTSWPVGISVDGEVPRPGHIYVAAPDRHLMIEGERMRLTRGPRESHARPSIDVLFRSAAYYAGPRVIGIVLTGRLDDGTAGLWAIKDRGGVAIVQSLDEAPQASMPRSALQHVAVDHALRIEEMGRCLLALTREPLPPGEAAPVPNDKLATEVGIALQHEADETAVLKLGAPSFYTCPECHGALIRIREGEVDRFRCHTGHAYTARALVDDVPRQVEKTLVSAQAQLEEYRMILKEIARATKSHSPEATRYAKRLDALDGLLQQVRSAVSDPALESSAQE